MPPKRHREMRAIEGVHAWILKISRIIADLEGGEDIKP
jgi:hypothetical protein